VIVDVSGPTDQAVIDLKSGPERYNAPGACENAYQAGKLLAAGVQDTIIEKLPRMQQLLDRVTKSGAPITEEEPIVIHSHPSCSPVRDFAKYWKGKSITPSNMNLSRLLTVVLMTSTLVRKSKSREEENEEMNEMIEKAFDVCNKRPTGLPGNHD
jgi:hypothetical protein